MQYTIIHGFFFRLENSNLIVRLGEWSFASTSEEFPHQDIRVVRRSIHPNYSGNPYHHNNIALLFLERPADLQLNVNIICLPNEHEVFDHMKCVSTGWGKKAFGRQQKYSEIMKKVTLPLKDHRQCEAALRSTNKLGNNFFLHDSYLCAGGDGQDTCEGDGGSPLVCQRMDGSRTYVQVGIVAWGIGCNTPGLPAAYTDVRKMMPWIRSEIAEVYSLNPRITLG